MLHELKTWQEPFQAIWDDLKTFEYRLNDRDFKVGDVLMLKEFIPMHDAYTTRVIIADVKYILKEGFSIPEGYCIMQLTIIKKVEGNKG
jgi:hypothetical protein